MTINPDKPFTEMTSDELNEVYREIKRLKRDKPYKLPGKKTMAYIPPDWAKHLEACVEYTYRKGMIKSPTTYSFANWAVKQVISSILVEIRHERTNLHLKDSQ